MRTSAQTTYILLDRGTEDEALRVEINKVFGALGIKGIAEVAQRFPKLLELKQGLDQERANEEADGA